jgi:hypothetical protein
MVSLSQTYYSKQPLGKATLLGSASSPFTYLLFNRSSILWHCFSTIPHSHIGKVESHKVFLCICLHSDQHSRKQFLPLCKSYKTSRTSEPRCVINLGESGDIDSIWEVTITLPALKKQVLHACLRRHGKGKVKMAPNTSPDHGRGLYANRFWIYYLSLLSLHLTILLF